MKPFDLEAAERGEPICSKEGALFKFLEPGSDDRAWVAYKCDGSAWKAASLPRYLLRMAPKKRTVNVILLPDGKATYAEAGEPLWVPSDAIGGRAWPLEIEE